MLHQHSISEAKPFGRMTLIQIPPLNCPGVNITVERQVAEHSICIQRMLEDLDDFSKPIEIGIGESVMKKVIEDRKSVV